jgi:hypothetical protein
VQAVAATKFGVQRPSLARLAAVSKALTAMRCNHENLGHYLHNDRARRKENFGILMGDVQYMVDILKQCFGSTWETAKHNSSPLNLLSLRAVPPAQRGSHKIQAAFSGIPQWLEAVHASKTLFEQVDLEALDADYHTNPQDAESAAAEAAEQPSEQNVAPPVSLAVAVSTWCKTHNTTLRESEDEQRQQALSLLGPHVARQALLAQNKAAAAAAAEEEQRKEAEVQRNRATRRAERVYTIDTIVDKRVVEGEVQYRVNWEGYDARSNTWESEENLQNARQKIAHFESKRKSKKAKVK